MASEMKSVMERSGSRMALDLMEGKKLSLEI
jgi:hypothetical protein